MQYCGAARGDILEKGILVSLQSMLDAIFTTFYRVQRSAVIGTAVRVTIGYSDSFLLPKRTSLYRKSSDTVVVGFSDTFVNPRGCHCNRILYLGLRIQNNTLDFFCHNCKVYYLNGVEGDGDGLVGESVTHSVLAGEVRRSHRLDLEQ